MEDRIVSLNAINEIFKRWIKIADFCHEDTDTLRNTLQEINELSSVIQDCDNCEVGNPCMSLRKREGAKNDIS